MKLKIEHKWELTPEGFGQFITKSDAQATKVRLQRKLKYKKRVTKLPKTGNKRVTKCVKQRFKGLGVTGEGLWETTAVNLYAFGYLS